MYVWWSGSEKFRQLAKCEVLKTGSTLLLSA